MPLPRTVTDETYSNRAVLIERITTRTLGTWAASNALRVFVQRDMPGNSRDYGIRIVINDLAVDVRVLKAPFPLPLEWALCIITLAKTLRKWRGHMYV